jgi:hypothetical protein
MKRILIILALVMMSIFIAQSFGQKTNQSGRQSPQVSTPVTEQTAETNARSQSGRAFTREEKAELVSRLLANPRMAEKLRGQRSRVLTVTLASDDKAPVRVAERRIAQVVLFNYTSGGSTRLLVDASSAEVLSEEPIRGRPQSSEEEIQEAIGIIRQDREVARLLQERGVIEGGFVVDGPPRAKPDHRFLQLQVLSSDRLRLQRVVVVDLTDRTIALSRANY